MSRVSVVYPSPLGDLILAGEGEALTGGWFEGQRHFGGGDIPPGEAPVFEAARRWLDAFFAGEDPGPTPRLQPAGTAFQEAVWVLLTEIPRGQTVTYGALASALAQRGRPTSARAVGSAVARNPISLFIPCHRVVGSDGSLTGYAGGVEKKRALLVLEGVELR